MNTKKVTINVTQEHCDKGIPRNSCCCPVALAFEEAGYEKPNVDVFDCVSVWVGPSRRRKNLCLNDDSLAQKILDFDKTGKMKPFSFTFDDEMEEVK